MKDRWRKHILTALLVAAMTMVGVAGCTPGKEPGSADEIGPVRLGIIQYATHPSLDAAREGFLSVLREAGYEEGAGLKVTLANAEGDQPTIRSIAQQLALDNLDMILAIATPAAQAMANATTDTPILITAVTDPVAAKLVESLERPGGNVTGTSDYVSVETQLDLIRTILPQMTRLGVIYNSGEENSLVQVEQVLEYAAGCGLTVYEATPTNSSEVSQAAQSLVGRVDAIYVPTDNTVVSALEAVVKVCNDEKIPLFPAEGDSVTRGGLASAGVDYYKLGEQTGRQALAILEGASPSEIPVEVQADVSVIVNLKAARIVEVHIPDEVQNMAVETIDD